MAIRDPSTVNWSHVTDIVFRKLNPDAGNWGSEFPRAAACCDCGRGYMQNGVRHTHCTDCNRKQWRKQKSAPKP